MSLGRLEDDLEDGEGERRKGVEEGSGGRERRKEVEQGNGGKEIVRGRNEEGKRS